MDRTSIEPKIRRQDVDMVIVRLNPKSGKYEPYETVGLVAVDLAEDASPEERAEAEAIVAENQQKLEEMSDRRYQEWYDSGRDIRDPAFQQWKRDKGLA